MDNKNEIYQLDAVSDASTFDADDLLAFGVNYFPCGWQKEKFNNYNFSIALALIGLTCADKQSGRSNYHNGVTCVASNLGITKRQIKVIRKKMKYKKGFCFKTPYNIPIILSEVIRLLKENESNPQVAMFLSQQSSKMYREILIERQFEAIKESANKGKRDRVKKVANELRDMTIKVGE